MRNLYQAFIIGGLLLTNGVVNAQEATPTATPAAVQTAAPSATQPVAAKPENTPTTLVPLDLNPVTTAQPQIKPSVQPSATTTVVPQSTATPTVSSAPQTAVTAAEKPVATPQKQLTPEEQAVVPYYNNFLENYYLGPQDVISINVFGQCPNYCRANITVPPNGKISYPLIRGGVVVNGKTVDQVAEEIKKKLDEYIIDPEVDVQLDKAMSATYSILGDVGAPGVRVLTHRVNLVEAIAGAGSFLPTADRKAVVILRANQAGAPTPIVVNLKDIGKQIKVNGKKGKEVNVPEPIYLAAGDQIIVPGKKIPVWQKMMELIPIISFARGIMTGGF